MSEQQLGNVTYWEGYPPWGEQSRKGALVLVPPNLIFRSIPGEQLLMPLAYSTKYRTVRMEIKVVGNLKKHPGEELLVGLATALFTGREATEKRAHGLRVVFYDEVEDTHTVYFRCEEYLAKEIAQAVDKAIFLERRQSETTDEKQIELLRKLDELRKSGVLTEEEFRAKKEQILRRK